MHLATGINWTVKSITVQRSEVITAVCHRGMSALQALAALQNLRAGGMAESAVAAAHSLRPKITVTTFEHKRIWWMPAVPVRAVAA